ncbi:hypothetical protein SAMN05216410_0813 [Sanguibacter gelidistatuariae]|uniref:Uncharacterized protein n=1 Tax=Sanguibacter gelidistatuariae TaxID=1814289 RepID=A0A1G6H7X9_9MICO|nr:hypothetical protein [Sanguibacter gelidistatuariae]SDB90254.1 hypothetical protein SAMN05216410_0813 [Sanguibacter gelidistatuariae]
MKMIAAYFGLADDGARVRPGASVAISLILSLAVSLGLRVLLPGASSVLRLILWVVVMLVIFRWAGSNAAKQRERARGRRDR